MIREATRDDVERLVELAKKHSDKYGWEELSGGTFDSFTMGTLARYHIRHKDAVVFVWEEDGEVVGALAGSLLPFLLDIRRHAAHEKMTIGDHQDELREAFDAWAKKENAVTVVRGCYDTYEGSRFRRI